MSVRDELIEIVTRDPKSSGGDVTWATDLVDAYRAEVLAEAGGAYQTCDTCGAGYLVGWSCGTCVFNARMAAGAGVKPSREADATPDAEAPYTDSETAFMQIGMAHWPRRAVLIIDDLPPLVGTYNGAGMRRLDRHDGLLVEPMLAFADRPEESTGVTT